MAGDDLIAAYVSDLALRLPQGIVEELADGLNESYERNRERGIDHRRAAALAVHDFGDADHVVAEFVRQSAGRRAAGVLLFSGPVVGLAWGVSMVAMRAWDWPVPFPARIGFATIFVAVILLLASARGAATWKRAKRAAYGAMGLVALDSAIVGVALTMAPSKPWTAFLAVAMSLCRSGFAIRSIPGIMVR